MPDVQTGFGTGLLVFYEQLVVRKTHRRYVGPPLLNAGIARVSTASVLCVEAQAPLSYGKSTPFRCVLGNCISPFGVLRFLGLRACLIRHGMTTLRHYDNPLRR